MEYVRKLLQETDYPVQLKKLEQLEEKREFCRHGLQHVLDVARIAWIQILEKGIQIEKETVYLTALLHDMGRIREYQEGIPHQEAGVIVAQDYLEKIEYPEKKWDIIFSAIGEHRKKESPTGEKEENGKRKDTDKLKEDYIRIIRMADNKSRNCFFCEADRECKWNEERKNRTIEY